jgi:two-component system cell cycle sensor histidine kinase/response regulator CckA
MARILIVEDEFLIFEDLKYQVQRLGHAVIAHATSGEAAVQQAVDAKPDLVLMDVRLEGTMNGVEAARLLRERHPVPVVYVTAHGRAVEKEIDAGRREFVLVKPFSPAQLQAVIVSAMGGSTTDDTTVMF